MPTRVTTAAEAKTRIGTLGRKFPDTTRKGWEARKEFAADCGIDVKVFNKGLGPQLNRFATLVKGVNEVNALIAVDDRSFKAFPPEKAKLDVIVKAYLQIVTPKLSNKNVVEYYGWWALDTGLKNIQHWADGIAKEAAAQAKKGAALRRG